MQSSAKQAGSLQIVKQCEWIFQTWPYAITVNSVYMVSPRAISQSHFSASLFTMTMTHFNRALLCPKERKVRKMKKNINAQQVSEQVSEQVSVNENPVSISEEKTLLLLSKALENKVSSGNGRALNKATLEECGVDSLMWASRIFELYSATYKYVSDLHFENSEIVGIKENADSFWKSWNDILSFASKGRKTRARAYGTDIQFFAFALRNFAREAKKEMESKDGSASVEAVRKQVFGFANFNKFKNLVEWALGKRFLGEVLSDEEDFQRKESAERAKQNEKLRKRALKNTKGQTK